MFLKIALSITLILAFGTSAVRCSAEQPTPPQVVQVDVLDRIYPDLEPKPFDGLARVPRGGTFSFQYALASDSPGDCTMEILPLIRENDGHELKASYRLYSMIAVPIEANSQGCSKTYPLPATPPAEWDPFLIRKAPFEIYEALLESATVQLPEGRYAGALLDVEVSVDAESGMYSGGLRFGCNGAVTEVPVQLFVHSTRFTNYSLASTNWLWPEPVNLTSGTPPEWWSEEHWKLIENSAKTLRRYGQTMVLTQVVGSLDNELARHPLIRTHITTSGDHTFDYSLFERWCRMMFDLGFEDIEGAHMGGGHVLKSLFVYAIDDKTGETVELFNRASDLEEYLKFTSIFFQDLHKKLEEKGWTNRYVQHLMDEPHSVEEYRRIADVFRRTMPGVRSFDAIQKSAFSPYCDVLVFNLPAISGSQPLVLERRTEGKSVWHYQCCSPYPPNPNRWLDRTLANSRLFPWLGYLLNSDGYLFWGANIYRGADPYESSIGPLPGGSQDPGHCVGDNWLFYRGPKGLRGAMRMVAFRDGLLDHALLRMLAEKDKEQADALMNRIARSISDFTEDPEDYHQARKDLLEALDSL